MSLELAGERALRIKLLLMDCDGVLTDGRLYFTSAGESQKVFHVRDGQGIALWHEAGFKSGIISGRDSGEILQKRVQELGMHYLSVRSADKMIDFEKIIAQAGVTAGETAYVGDDLGDLSLMERVGLPVAVADAVPEVVEAAAYVTRVNGGHGAVREVIDMILLAKRAA